MPPDAPARRDILAAEYPTRTDGVADDRPAGFPRAQRRAIDAPIGQEPGSPAG